MALTNAKREIAIFLPVFIVSLHVWATMLFSGDFTRLIYYWYLWDAIRNPLGDIPSFLGAITTTGFVYLYYKLVRWVASTAEKSGRSYAGFMILAILFPVIAATIVLILKKDHSFNP